MIAQRGALGETRSTPFLRRDCDSLLGGEGRGEGLLRCAFARGGLKQPSAFVRATAICACATPAERTSAPRTKRHRASRPSNSAGRNDCRGRFGISDPAHAGCYHVQGYARVPTCHGGILGNGRVVAVTSRKLRADHRDDRATRRSRRNAFDSLLAAGLRLPPRGRGPGLP